MTQIPISNEVAQILRKRHDSKQAAIEAANREQAAINDLVVAITSVAGAPKGNYGVMPTPAGWVLYLQEPPPEAAPAAEPAPAAAETPPAPADAPKED